MILKVQVSTDKLMVLHTVLTGDWNHYTEKRGQNIHAGNFIFIKRATSIGESPTPYYDVTLDVLEKHDVEYSCEGRVSKPVPLAFLVRVFEAIGLYPKEVLENEAGSDQKGMVNF